MTWPTVTLNDLQSEEPRAITDGPFGSNLARRHYTEAGPRVVRLQNIGDGRFVDEKAHISEEHFESLRAHEVKAGDLLVASLGEVLPRACLAPVSLGPAIVKADCIRVRLRQDVDPRWVLYAMQRPEVRRWADEHRHGVGRPRLGLRVIRQIPVPLPPVEEQRRIVDLLEDHLSRLDAARNYLAAAATRGHVLLNALRTRLWTQAESLARSSPVRDFAQVDSGPAFKSAEFGLAGEGVRLLRGDNIEPGSMRWANTKTFTSELTPRLERLLISEDDLILAMDRPVISSGLKLARARGHDLPALLVQRVARIRCGAGILPGYLEELLNEPRFAHSLLADQVGTQVPHITLEDIRRYRVPVPSVEQQRSLLAGHNDVLEENRRMIQAIGEQARLSENLRRSLMAAAFSGRLTGAESDLSAAEEMIGA